MPKIAGVRLRSPHKRAQIIERLLSAMRSAHAADDRSSANSRWNEADVCWKIALCCYYRAFSLVRGFISSHDYIWSGMTLREVYAGTATHLDAIRGWRKRYPDLEVR